MELPTFLTDGLFIAVVVILALMPLAAGYGTFRMGQVLLADTERPRNPIVRRMFWSGVITTVVSVYITLLCVAALMNIVQGEAVEADFGAVTFAAALIALEIQPYLKWITLSKLSIMVDPGVPETQSQREDRQFGEQRRQLEQEHLDENLTD